MHVYFMLQRVARDYFGSLLKTGQHYIFVIIWKIKNNTRSLNTLFIDDFIDVMEQYFHYLNHNWQCNSVAQTKDLYSCDSLDEGTILKSCNLL